MTWIRVEEDWDTYKHHIKETWSQLTHDDINLLVGRRDLLVKKLQERYELDQEDADLLVETWQYSLSGLSPSELNTH